MNIDLLKEYSKKDYFDASAEIVDVFQCLYPEDNGHGMEHILSVLDRALTLHKSYEQQESNKEDNNQYVVGIGVIKIYTLAACMHDMFQDVDREHHHMLSGLFIDYVSDTITDKNNRRLVTLNNYGVKLNHNNYLKKALDKLSLKINLPAFLNKLLILAIKETAIFNKKNLGILRNICHNHRSSLKVLTYDRTDKTLEKFVLVFRAADKEPPVLSDILKRMFISTINSDYVQNIPEDFKLKVKNLYKGKYILNPDQLIKIHHHLVDKFYIDGYMFKDKEDIYNLLYKDEITQLHEEIADLLDNDRLEEYLNYLFPYITVKVKLSYLSSLTENILRSKANKVTLSSDQNMNTMVYLNFLEYKHGDVYDVARFINSLFTYTGFSFNITGNVITVSKIQAS